MCLPVSNPNFQKPYAHRTASCIEISTFLKSFTVFNLLLQKKKSKKMLVWQLSVYCITNIMTVYKCVNSCFHGVMFKCYICPRDRLIRLVLQPPELAFFCESNPNSWWENAQLWSTCSTRHQGIQECIHTHTPLHTHPTHTHKDTYMMSIYTCWQTSLMTKTFGAFFLFLKLLVLRDLQRHHPTT